MASDVTEIMPQNAPKSSVGSCLLASHSKYLTGEESGGFPGGFSNSSTTAGSPNFMRCDTAEKPRTIKSHCLVDFCVVAHLNPRLWTPMLGLRNTDDLGRLA